MAGGREDSDMLHLEPVTHSIPPVAEVLTPPEEIARLRRRKIIIIVISIVTAIIVAIIAYFVYHAASVRSATLRAGDSGSTEAIQDALDSLHSGESPGLVARLGAMRVLRGEIPLEEGQGLLEAVSSDDADEAAERLKAAALLALAAGDATAANTHASSLVPQGTYAAEVAYVRARCGLEVGDLQRAVQESDGILALPDHAHGPRYRALAAIAKGIAGDLDGALAALEGAQPADAPSVRAARARVLAAARRTGALEEADAVLADATASAPERAWATLVKADIASQAGLFPDAMALLSDLQAPVGDVHFRWRLAEIFARMGNAERATAALDGLSTVAPSAALVGRVRAHLQVLGGDATGAMTTLSTVPGGPDALLVAAEAQLAARLFDAARTSCQTAQGTPGWEGHAREILTRVELAAGNAAAAAAAGRSAVEARPGHPAIAATASRAILAAGDAPAALALIEPIATAHPENTPVLRAQADALLAQDRHESALLVLRRLAELRPEDLVAHRDRGLCAHKTGELDEADAAYARALELDDDDHTTLLRYLELRLDRHQIDEAGPLLDQIKNEEIAEEQYAVMWARYLVDSGAGTSGTRTVTRLLRRRGLRREAYLKQALAELYLQGGLFNPAVSMFRQAIRFEGDVLECLGGIALAHSLDGKANRANDALDEAREASPQATEHPRVLVALARIQLNLGRTARAAELANQALAARPGMTEAHLIIAEGESRGRRGNPEAAIEAALAYPMPQPSALALRARRIGPNEQGCAMGRRYRELTSSRAPFRDQIDDFLERCD